MPKMSVKETAKRQYARLLDQAAQQTTAIKTPKQGWLATMRKALGMSAPQLAERMSITKPAIYQAERQEPKGGITLKQMEKFAEAMGGRFVYAIVPESSVEDIVREQAHKKAEAVVKRASSHMALEKQSLTTRQMQDEISRLTDELMRERPSDFWETR